MKNVIKQLCRGEFQNINKLPKNINEIIDGIGNDATLRGNFLELPIKLAAIFNHQDFDGMKVILDDTGIFEAKSFRDIKGGGSGGGRVDIHLVNKNTKTVLGISSKIKNNNNWSKTEIESAIDKIRRFYDIKGYTCKFGICVKDKEPFLQSSPQQSSAKQEWNNGNIKIYDIKGLLKQYWRFVWEEFEKYDFDVFELEKAYFNRNQKNIALRANQIEGVKWSIKKFNNGEKEILIAHKPRSGKTILSAEIIRKQNYKNILIVTGLPVLNYQWKEPFFDLIGFEKYQIFDIPGGDTFEKSDYNIVLSSFQGLDELKEKYKQVFKIRWDLVIIDEIHLFKSTERSENLLKKIKYNRLLGLSATPRKNLVLGEFTMENTHIWSYTDEQEAKNGTHKLIDKYPDMAEQYKMFPNIHFYMYKPSDKTIELASEKFKQEEQFTFGKFFQITDDENYFVEDAAVKEYITSLHGGNGLYKNAPLSWLKGNLTTVLMFVNNKKIQSVLKKYLENDDVIKRRYKVHIVNSDEYSASELLKEVNTFENGTQGKIILAVDQLQVGVTLPDCDMVMFLKDFNSQDRYIQASFRCQSPKPNKKECYVVDYLPYRGFETIYDYALSIENKKPNEEATVALERFLKCIQIHNVDLNGELTRIDANNFLEYYGDEVLKTKGYKNFFAKEELYDLSNLSKTEIKKWYEKLKDFNTDKLSAKYKKEVGNGKLGKGKTKEVKRGKKGGIDFKGKNDYITKTNNIIQSILSNTPWLSILSRLDDYSYIQALDSLSPEGKEIFEDIIGGDISIIYELIENNIIKLKDLDGRLVHFNSIFKNDQNGILEFMKNDKNSIKKYGDVFTPISLVEEMLDKLPIHLWKNPHLKWLDNAMGTGNFLICIYNRLMENLIEPFPSEEKRRKHILENMLYGVDLQQKYVFLAKLRLDLKEKYNLNLVCANSLDFDYWGGMKFDVIVGNPPYQAPQEAEGKRGGGDSLWDKFVKLALNTLLKENGYLCYIHPSRWRKPEDELWDLMTSKQIKYLRIVGEKESNKIFNMGTRCDWYILQNIDYKKPTIVIDEVGKESITDLREWKFLPNYNFINFKKLLAKNNEETCEVLYSRSAYGTDKKNMNQTKTQKFRYPCVHSLNENEKVFWYSNINTNGHFNILKIILSWGRIARPLNDYGGKYGMTQMAFGIKINSKNIGDKYIKFMNSDFFKEIIKCSKWMQLGQTEWRMFKYFKKNFYEIN